MRRHFSILFSILFFSMSLCSDLVLVLIFFQFFFNFCVGVLGRRGLVFSSFFHSFSSFASLPSFFPTTETFFSDHVRNFSATWHFFPRTDRTGRDGTDGRTDGDL